AWLVPPLSFPAADAGTRPEDLARYEAVQLFVERAGDVLPSFRLTDTNGRAVVQVCRRLDGIPLAIELAAARVRVLAPEQIAERLDDAFRLLTRGSRTAIPRHQTLRATVDWSYRLLGSKEQLLLQRLSVFAGEFSLPAAEAVCSGDGIDAAEVLDLVARLVDRSLVVMRERAGSASYGLLEIVRQYGRDRAVGAASLDRATRARHAAYFAELAEAGRPELERTGSSEWVERLRGEQDNIRAALRWSLTGGHDLEVALRLVSALWRFWFHANQWREGASWCEAMLATVAERPPHAFWIRALHGAGVFAYLARNSALCRERLEEADRLCQRLGDSELLAMTDYRLAHLYCDLGLDAMALARAESGLRHARESGKPWVVAEVLVYAVAFVHRVQGRPTEADAAFAEAGELAQQSAAWMALVEAAMGRALLALHRGDVAAAARHASQALAAARTLADDWYVSRALLIAAAAAVRAGNPTRAAQLLGFGAALREAAGTQVFSHEQAFYAETTGGVEQALGALETTRWRAVGAATPIEEIVRLVETDTVPPPAATGQTREHADTARRTSEPALRVITLGRTEIYQDGEPLSAEAWAYAKPMELLIYLAMYPDGRTREQVGVAFWPEASAAQVKNVFHVSLHQLRKRLGRHDLILYERNRYRVNAELGVEVDAIRFANEISAALRLGRSDTEAVAALQAALRDYGGDFLEANAAGDWHLEHRDHLRRLFINGLFALGGGLLAAQRFGEAVEAYQRLVRHEDLNEAAHRGLMEALARSGDRAQALRHYDRLVTLLESELEVSPEPATVDLADAIRSTGLVPLPD
ncbi:MAG: BTAD domain-containing putative transcriptional regulator, partial [Gemmatimonadales bacterium]